MINITYLLVIVDNEKAYLGKKKKKKKSTSYSLLTVTTDHIIKALVTEVLVVMSLLPLIRFYTHVLRHYTILLSHLDKLNQVIREFLWV